jgi:hypothetical protein
VLLVRAEMDAVRRSGTSVAVAARPLCRVMTVWMGPFTRARRRPCERLSGGREVFGA